MNNSSQSGITLMETLLYLGLLGLILTTAASLSLQSMEFLSKADQSLSTTGEVLFLSQKLPQLLDGTTIISPPTGATANSIVTSANSIRGSALTIDLSNSRLQVKFGNAAAVPLTSPSTKVESFSVNRGAGQSYLTINLTLNGHPFSFSSE
jgi:hypothetical protein